ncbi:uncharacterized protein [Diabrotica undecimpunctata]|uniref:uncharacterized protein n=1 Tax=Diabrotica undecimpunctata TaxID=50387 RepID=UPI003B6365B8
MSKISGLEPDLSPSYYLSHHAVEKKDSLTTKTRIVFDASCPTSTGISLNHTLKVGPVVQSDLFSILLRFREHNFVFTGDIAKMYRQVLVEPTQRNLQRVIWRNDPSQEINIYQLNTVTYGLASSSYLATRCLKEISIHSSATFPEEGRKLNLDTYVDDVVTGALTKQALIALRRNLTSILSSYGFNLRQFSSNSMALLSDINVDDHKEEYIITDSPNSKTLGISWNSSTDSIIYSTKIKPNPYSITKRTILSTVALTTWLG